MDVKNRSPWSRGPLSDHQGLDLAGRVLVFDRGAAETLEIGIDRSARHGLETRRPNRTMTSFNWWRAQSYCLCRRAPVDGVDHDHEHQMQGERRRRTCSCHELALPIPADEGGGVTEGGQLDGGEPASIRGSPKNARSWSMTLTIAASLTMTLPSHRYHSIYRGSITSSELAAFRRPCCARRLSPSPAGPDGVRHHRAPRPPSP